MLQFFSLAEVFLNSIMELGDFLMHTSVSDVLAPISPFLSVGGWGGTINLVLSLVGDTPLGFAIFSVSITGFIIWKFVCFITDVAS